MSALLSGRMRLSRAGHSSTGLCSRGYTVLRFSNRLGSGISPSTTAARAQQFSVRSKHDLSTQKSMQYGTSERGVEYWSANSSPRSLSSVASHKSATRAGAPVITKRYQHSQTQERTAEIDHSHIIASYPEWIKPQDTLPRRHIGPSDEDVAVMLETLSQPDLDAFIHQTIPDSIRSSRKFTIPSEQTPETEMLDELTKAGKANSAAEVDTYIGMGYHPTITPGVIKRNVLENPGWYTSYTPYQPEISQGMSS
jgi:hypothetical protein